MCLLQAVEVYKTKASLHKLQLGLISEVVLKINGKLASLLKKFGSTKTSTHLGSHNAGINARPWTFLTSDWKFWQIPTFWGNELETAAVTTILTNGY